MRMSMLPACGLAVLVLVAAAGCAGTQATSRQADLTYQRLAAGPADAPAAPGPTLPDMPALPTGHTPVLFFAPRAEPAPLDAAPVEVAAAREAVSSETPAAAKPAAGEKTVKPGEFPPFPEGTFWDVVKSDLREAPGKLWNGTKLSFGNLTNVAILGGTFGIDRIVRYNCDARVRHELNKEQSDWHATGDFGEVLGHPGLHFGLAGAWYFMSVANRDEKNRELSQTLIEALAINDLTTGLLQASVNQKDPRGDYYSWPSGHTSSSFCVAAVLHEYYGWQVGIPAYLASAGIAATRVGDRKHNISDVIFGAGLGLVIGHSVVKGELPQVGGFAVLPYAGDDDDTLGVMLMKQW